MTLILAVSTRESAWLLADRRLSTAGGGVLSDDARKVLILNTPDGVALLGYAGLGKTAGGTEPSDWMVAVLRGQAMTLERSLEVLGEAAQRELPPHMTPVFSLWEHHIVGPAFLGNRKRLYSIGVGSSGRYALTHWLGANRAWSLPLGAAGTGGHYLEGYEEWKRPLLRLVKSFNRGKLSANTVADYLANLNYSIHKKVPTVGPNCVVVWRSRPGSDRKNGSSHQAYTGTVRDREAPFLPRIDNGTDVIALEGVLRPHMRRMSEAMQAGRPLQLDADAINSSLARLPDTPDELLR